MKKKYLIVLIVSLFFGCSKEKDEVKKDATNFGVTIDEARLVANNASQFLNKGNNKKVLKRHAKTGVTATYNGNAAYHIFNYAEGGFVIIAADKRSVPILAYSDEAEFSNEDKPLGLSFWENTTKEHLKLLSKETKAKNGILTQWDDTSCPDNPAERVTCDDEGGGGTTIITRGPLMQSTWNQLCGYNDHCPVNRGTNAFRMCYRMPTGCVATAMAQVMRYWQFPNSYNWNNMPLNWGADETARLMRNLGTSVNMQYGEEGSSAYARDIGPALTSSFGYGQAEYKSHYNDDYTAIMDNIRLWRPVILGGCDGSSKYQINNCHAWVCDGFQQIYSNGYGYLNFHMNWGWGGRHNGWYIYDNWTYIDNTDIPVNFQYFQDMVINIHP